MHNRAAGARRLTQFSFLLIAACASGCTIGPNYSPPAPPLPTAWRESAGPSAPIAGQWWSMYEDACLNALIERADHANLDIRMAVQRVDAARILRRAAAADGLPQIDAQAGYSRERLGTNDIAGVVRPILGLDDMPGMNRKGYSFNLYNVSAGASWEVDLWGRQRRMREAAQAKMEAEQASSRGMRLSVQAEIARTYFQWRGLGDELAFTDKVLALGQEDVRIARALLGRGINAGTDVIDAESRLRSLQIERDELDHQRNLAKRALAVLVSGTPADDLHELDQMGPAPRIGPIASRLPSEMASLRPDIVAAAARLHAAAAAIGVAKGDFYPRISLTGRFDIDALSLSDVGWSSRDTSIGPTISLPIFSGGRLERQLELRKAEERNAALTYRATVIAAWQEIEDDFSTLRMLDGRIAALDAEAASQEKRAKSFEQRSERGDIASRPVLEARQLALQAEIGLSRQKTAVLIQQVQLVRALGG